MKFLRFDAVFDLLSLPVLSAVRAAVALIQERPNVHSLCHR
jgi:hypothetical protein